MCKNNTQTSVTDAKDKKDNLLPDEVRQPWQKWKMNIRNCILVVE